MKPFARQGFTFLEVTVAFLLLSTLLVVCLRFFSATNDQGRQALVEMVAAEEAANLMERTQSLPWEELSAKAASQFQLSPEARQVLPEGRAMVEINEIDKINHVDKAAGPPSARRVMVKVCWLPIPGGRQREVRLAAWRYKKP